MEGNGGNFISIIILTIVTFTCIVFSIIKNLENKGYKQYIVCYIIVLVCTALLCIELCVPKIILSSITSIISGVYSAVIFALIFTVYSEQKIQSFIQDQEKRKGGIDTFLENCKKEHDNLSKILSKLSTRFNSYILKADTPNNIYERSTHEKNIDSDFYKDLYNGIKTSSKYTYEGDDAFTGSICLHHLIQNKDLEQSIDLNFILADINSFQFDKIDMIAEDDQQLKDDNKKRIKDYFVTITILHRLRKRENVKLNILIRSSLTAHFVHLTDSALWFSPFTVKTRGEKPRTYQYLCPQERIQSFYSLYKASINSRMSHFRSVSINNQSSLFRTLTQFGLEDDLIKEYVLDILNISSYDHMQRTIEEFFIKEIELRFESYKNIKVQKDEEN